MTQQSAEIPFTDPQDALVEKGSVASYTEARDALGMPQPDSAQFTADAIRARIAEQPTDHAHERWIARLGLSAPRSEFPDGIPRASEKQKAVNTRAVAHLKSLSQPTKE